MSDVVDLQTKRIERHAHWSGMCRCMGCGHEFLSVQPLGVTDDVPCPNCKCDRGVPKFNFCPAEDLRFTCGGCGSQVFTMARQGARCVGCGVNHPWENVIND